MESLSDAVGRAVPRLQNFRMRLGEFHAVEQLRLLLVRQLFLPLIRIREFTEDLAPISFKPHDEPRQVLEGQLLNSPFQFLHAHGLSLPLRPSFANKNVTPPPCRSYGEGRAWFLPGRPGGRS